MKETECINANYCDLVQFIDKKRREIEYGEIKIPIRKHQLVHADISVLQRLRIPLTNEAWKPKNQ